MNLRITFDNPSPPAACQYKAQYRRKSDPSYSTILSSGSTAAVAISAPANYEGNIFSDCCSSNLSVGAPFGVNSYQQVHVVVTKAIVDYTATITSAYPNPYDTYLSGTFDITISGATTTWLYDSVLYPAGSTSAQVSLPPIPPVLPNMVISNTTISTVVPSFNGGGQLQQLDVVNTPPYFKFLSTSGTTWTGAPIDLPSFTLDTFTPTSQDESFNVLTGDLLVSWIQDTVFHNAVNPYNILTLRVRDQDSAVLGTLNVLPLKGLNTATISLTRAARALNTSNQFTMQNAFGDGITVSTKNFYLP